MSTQFKNPPHAFVKHDDVKLVRANTAGVGPTARDRIKDNSVALEGRPAPLRDGHIVLVAVDVLAALHASFKQWRNHRRTMRALADLDEHQLRDIGLTREEALLGHQHYRALDDPNEVRRRSP
jgi:hypothetical protein